MKILIPETEIEKKAFEIGICFLRAMHAARDTLNSGKEHGSYKFEKPKFVTYAQINSDMIFKIMKICEEEGIPHKVYRKFLDSAKAVETDEREKIALNSSYYLKVESELVAIMEVLSA